MKKLLMVAALGAAGLVSGTAHAASTLPENFNVDITLTSACAITAPADVVLTYTSNQITNATSTGGGFTVTCTNLTPYTFNLDASATAASGGTTLGLNYTLDVQNTVPATVAGGTGSGAAQSYAVHGQIAAGQGGNCAVSPCNSVVVHTVQVDF
jgi:spore coat protein U-like protein